MSFFKKERKEKEAANERGKLKRGLFAKTAKEKDFRKRSKEA